MKVSLRRLLRHGDNGGDLADYRVIDAQEMTPGLAKAWQRSEVASRQGELVDRELVAMRLGQPPRVYQVAAEALRTIGLSGERIIEIGCASGYYSEVLEYLLEQPVDYVGIDYSGPLLCQARRRYPHRPFLLGDTCAIPLRDRAAPVVISGCVLLHVRQYVEAILETVRVSDKWVVFHRTPVTTDGPTRSFRKLAYGVPVIEHVFAQDHLLEVFASCGLAVEHASTVEVYRVPGVVDSASVMTYVCQRV